MNELLLHLTRPINGYDLAALALLSLGFIALHYFKKGK